MDRYDSIIVGGGHNGLVCAAYLARQGRSVLVLEGTDRVGGLARSFEFHPGFSASVAHSVGHFSSQVAKDLQLRSHGYSATQNLALTGLTANHPPVVLSGTDAVGIGDDDQAALRRYHQQLAPFANALAPFWFKTMPRLGAQSLSDVLTFAQLGLKTRLMGRDNMQEFLRMASLPARDLMDEFFSNPLLKAALSWDGLIGSRMAPRSPNSAVLMMLYRLSEQQAGGSHSAGVAGLVAALQGACEAAGATIRCDSPVQRVRIDTSGAGLSASGVELVSGEIIHARRVISSLDPRSTFIKLVGVEHLDIGFTNRIRRLRCDGLVGKLHLALTDLPAFTGLERPDGRLIIAPDMDAIEFAYDDSKYGRCSESPVLEVVIPSLHNAEMAPAGKHTLSAHVMFVPRHLKGGWTDAARNDIAERAVAAIERVAPGTRQLIAGKQFLSPQDLETDFGVTGGHWHHTEFAMDQMLMMRPTYEAAQYRTPIPGLFLCGAGCHPGGDLTGAPGHNAAKEVLK